MLKKTVLAIFSSVLIISAIFSRPAFVDAFGGFPEIMFGNTTVTVNGQTVYGGLNGNYAILNSDSSASYGFKDSTLVNTCLSDAVGPVCFFLGTGVDGSSTVGTQGGRLMTAKTTIDGDVVYEIPALLFSGINIRGDVSGDFSSSYLLKFWRPDSLNKGINTSDGNAWKLSNYVYNPSAQATLTGPAYDQYKERLTTLAGNAASITNKSFLLSFPYLYLQSNGLISDNNSTDALKYPEGKVWVVNGDLTLNSAQKFSGVGTIIINNGDFILGPNANLLPDSTVPGNNRLGIIVLKDATHPTKGNCKFNGNNKIQAMMLCANTLSATSNGEFTGSFVATDFTVNTGASVIFNYDPTFDNNQPPGFRNLAMPRSEEVGNQP